MTVCLVAMQILREAIARKWVVGLWLGITTFLILLHAMLQFEVVDGAIAATQFLGSDMGNSIRSADVALRPVFRVASYALFYGGLFFGITACASFATTLLAPGRVDFLLALPISRSHVLAGSFLGVLTLALGGAMYGAGGLVLIMGLKTGYWATNLLVSALFAASVFAALYAVMLTFSVFVPHTPTTILVGALGVFGGIFASDRAAVMAELESELLQNLVGGMLALLPRVARVADYAAEIAGGGDFQTVSVLRTFAGIALFALASLAVGIWGFERKDF